MIGHFIQSGRASDRNVSRGHGRLSQCDPVPAEPQFARDRGREGRYDLEVNFKYHGAYDSSTGTNYP